MVYLVGAGPGDPDLLTVKAHRLLAQADVVVYDRLVSEDVLALAPAGTTRISVGKAPKNHPVPQDEINRLLVGLAQPGRTVVRLKGGDPFVFGRGSEEAAVLAAHGIRFEVVPGVTAAAACAAAVGVPLTHRGLASGVRFVTGHSRGDAELDLDWRGLADPDTTLVLYMSMATIGQIAGRLIGHGLPASTPAAAINNGTTSRQRHLITTLGEMPERVAAAGFAGPVLFVVGRAVAMAGVLSAPAEATEVGDDERRARLA
jgi:uroporphyrin-III C-methyltransferase/precorrin-2 dehydrogenase/sirohydrochlorin ferrochelatase/uroporphyrin-III C-methyltransferase